MVRIGPLDLAGHRLESVTSEWHEFVGVCGDVPIHIWLRVERVGSVQLHTLDGLVMCVGKPEGTVDMGEHGRTVVTPGGPAPIADKIGLTICSVDLLEQFHQGRSMGTVGALLEFATGRVGVADLGDDLVVEPWPGRWASWSVSIQG